MESDGRPTPEGKLTLVGLVLVSLGVMVLLVGIMATAAAGGLSLGTVLFVVVAVVLISTGTRFTRPPV